MNTENNTINRPNDVQYKHTHVELEEVIANPNEYIIPQCQPCCRTLWGKNIETFMVSNNEDKDLYVLLMNLSAENKARLQQLSASDPRFFYDSFRGTYGIGVRGNNSDSTRELLSLSEALQIQDTMRFENTETFLAKFKKNGGEMFVENDGTIHRKDNPEYANITFQEALKKSGKESLYVASEGRIYESSFYLNWHKRYEKYLEDSMKGSISDITPYKGNVDGNIAHLRDTYLSSEREYVAELLKSDSVRELIHEINAETPEELFAIAQDLVNKIEMGLIPDEQMVKAEQKLTVILAAIQDKVLVKDLVLVSSLGDRSK